MHHCLTLAENGRGKTGINPMVGAVLVREGKIIAEGWHEAFGGRHAEASLFNKFDQQVRSDDTFYVNLEPCCHTEKKTPPCVDLLIERGAKHVVVGMVDPNPAVAGKGIERLRENGVEVTVGMERARCEWLNRGFISLQTRGRPWVTLKQARTPEGSIAAPDGSPLKITSPEQDAWSHRMLRARHDAILVGVGTVVRDDPQLTARCEEIRESRDERESRGRYPVRIVLDPHLRIPLDARVVGEGTMVIRAKETEGTEATKVTEEELLRRGVWVWEVQMDEDGSFDFPDLWRVLTTPGEGFPGIASILVEGGAETWRRFRAERAVDAEVTLIGDGAQAFG